jgi:hypothetical protein
LSALHPSSPRTPHQASQLQRLEVRAFGYLLQESLAHSPTVASPCPRWPPVRRMFERGPWTPALFAAIEQTLAGLRRAA